MDRRRGVYVRACMHLFLSCAMALGDASRGLFVWLADGAGGVDRCRCVRVPGACGTVCAWLSFVERKWLSARWASERDGWASVKNRGGERTTLIALCLACESVARSRRRVCLSREMRMLKNEEGCRSLLRLGMERNLCTERTDSCASLSSRKGAEERTRTACGTAPRTHLAAMQAVLIAAAMSTAVLSPVRPLSGAARPTHVRSTATALPLRIDGQWYDLSEYADEHPGGERPTAEEFAQHCTRKIFV